MPNSSKKQKTETVKVNIISPPKAKQKSDCNATTNNNNNNMKKPRKRKRRKVEMSSDETDLESELEECNFEDALALERKLRKVAKTNSLNDEEMKKLLQKFVKNDHVLALVTLQAEDELAREQRESEQPAIIITDNPSVPKLTRAKARELNKTPAITLPTLNDAPQPEIVALINQDLQSDDEDEEYTFKEEDFVSDDDHNNTNSDFDSNPCTPQTPQTQTEYEDSPVKLTSDGCFKIPLDKQDAAQENLRIAARTRSKLCLQQTTIEDIQSEFVPPDVDLNENHDTDLTTNDKEWTEFLSYISNPLNNSLLGDDDDLVNDPEYVAADKETMDAEELRNVNISKKELTDLFAELFEGLVNEGISLESVDLETPEKFLQNNSALQESPTGNKLTPTPNTDSSNVNTAHLADVTRQIDFNVAPPNVQQAQQICVSDDTISSTNVAQQNYSFQTDVMSNTAPAELANSSMNTQNTVIPVASNADPNNSDITIPAAISAPELIAIPVPGQPNSFNLARVVSPNRSSSNDLSYVLESSNKNNDTTTKPSSSKYPHDFVSRYTLPYDNNFTWRYISIRRHVYTEYMDKFENLRNIKNDSNDAVLVEDSQATGFTAYQHDLLQQQLRIHVQMLTQTYVQIYCHPEYWKSAPEVRSMLDDLQEKSKTHATFNAWNLKGAIDIVEKWEEDLATDTPENKAFMEFIHKEIAFCCHNTRQVPRFPPRIMELILNSNVFMYPNYLPRIPFTPKHFSYHLFAPSEYLLIALGLEKHLSRMKKMKIKRTASPYVIACKHIAKDTIFGKSTRRIYDQMKKLLKADYYNPVKYYFEHKRAPPVEQHLISFENNTVLPPVQRFQELPLAWQNYIQEKNKSTTAPKQTNVKTTTPAPATPPRPLALNYLDIVREAVGENIQLPDSITAAEPAASVTDTTNTNRGKRKRNDKRRQNLPSSVTINVNYVFSGTPSHDISNLVNSTSNTQPNITTISVSPHRALPSNNYQSAELATPIRATTAPLSSNIVAYNYDFNRQHLEPVIAEITEIPFELAPETPSEVPASQIVQQKITPKSTVAKAYRQYLRPKRQNWRYSHNHNKRFGTARQRHRAALLYRQKNSLKKRLLQLLTSYHQNLQQQELRYKRSPLLLRYFKQFKALDLYTSLLDNLKMICRNAAQANHSNATTSSKIMPTAQSAHTPAAKRPRLDEDGGNTTRSNKKINRQEENLRNMLLPDTPEDANRKDAIYAFNFYEKVEEIFKADNRLEDYEKFNNILKSFDPKCDRAADLYNKLEALFMPDYPLLAQVFLTFLLPAEAAEIGKFFEHFMITNSTTFYNKLNIYFSNQPAQMRKILNCLNEMAEEEDVTMKKLEEKILPLLKGNQFLIDWFMQQFPEAPVPERILPAPENVILKEAQGNKGGESMETMRDLLDSPTSDQHQTCQLRYINGRIFYGSKFTLPAKLSFMASKSVIKDEKISSPPADLSNFGCLHGIKEHGEARLAAAVAAAASTPANTSTIHILSEGTSNEGNDKSEEDEMSKALVIDTTSTDDSCSSIETCDDATLRAHALRLNPSYYSSTCFSSMTATSTPNIGNAHQSHHPNAKKQSLNFYDDVKLSPRKTIIGSPIDIINFGASSTPTNTREKRKSPTKKIKSPNSANTSSKSHQAQQRAQQQPMVVIPRGEHGAGAIAFAQKLKTLVDSSDEQSQSPAGVAPTAVSAQVPIVARVKQRPFIDLTTTRSNDSSGTVQHNLVPKLENSDDLEFLPEHTPPFDDQTEFPRLRLDPDSSTEDSTVLSTKKVKEQQPAQNAESDEDYKVDIVATLTTGTQSSDQQSSDANPAATTSSTRLATNAAQSSTSVAFTRDEDKILLLEMQAGSRDRNDLVERISKKLPQRTRAEIIGRHQFLIDFLSRMQGN